MRTATLRCNNGCFVVLSADFLTVPAKQIEGMRALATGGKQVYAAAGWIRTEHVEVVGEAFGHGARSTVRGDRRRRGSRRGRREQLGYGRQVVRSADSSRAEFRPGDTHGAQALECLQAGEDLAHRPFLKRARLFWAACAWAATLYACRTALTS